VLLRLAVAAAAALVMWGLTGAWTPPFPFRTGTVPLRDVVARIEFSRPDPERTAAKKKQRASETTCVYNHDPRSLGELRKALKDKVFQVTRVEAYEQLDKDDWRDFLPKSERGNPAAEEQSFTDFRETLADDMELSRFDQAVQRAMQPLERDGLLETLQHTLEEGNHTAILVRGPWGEPEAHRVEVKDVRIAEVLPALSQRLLAELRKERFPETHVERAAQLVFTWLSERLPTTLTFDDAASKKARDELVAAVKEELKTYKPGDKLANGGKVLETDDLALLLREHQAVAAAMSVTQLLGRTVADLGMYLALYCLCGFFIYHRARKLIYDWRRFGTLLALVVATVALCKLLARDQFQAELAPLLLFALTATIAYRQELALLLSAAVALIVVLSLGQGLVEFVILGATAAAAVQFLGRIRSRTKLIYVGTVSGVVALATTLGVGTLARQGYGAMTELIPLGGFRFFALDAYAVALWSDALWYGLCAIVAGVLMTGLLPFVERGFDVQTDISLLEMGDAAHPLLQELVRRAPGTYNHSINVASIAEAAAEAIGANGLLVRVGAYFHDIGKMLKPGYFVENQGQDANRHESLLPAMSTLVIIAHVKDGADLARQHRLPQSIIDFIEQHHGTTLVEYFYRQAERKSETDPESSEVDESSFRYPGPKPQTKEAGVLMLADSVESASRALVDPAPARIESLVHDLALKKLLDGQFEECGLTLQELHTIETSLIKSLTAVYHGRVKYPKQSQTA
jgi:putative nucleotidyltransferase with HDIG domain